MNEIIGYYADGYMSSVPIYRKRKHSLTPRPLMSEDAIRRLYQVNGIRYEDYKSVERLDNSPVRKPLTKSGATCTIENFHYL